MAPKPVWHCWPHCKPTNCWPTTTLCTWRWPSCSVVPARMTPRGRPTRRPLPLCCRNRSAGICSGVLLHSACSGYCVVDFTACRSSTVQAGRKASPRGSPKESPEENPMKYLLLVYGAESAWTQPEREQCMAESIALCHELAADGRYLAAAPLHSVTTATSVRNEEGRKIVVDGPFAETHEQLGGY